MKKNSWFKRIRKEFTGENYKNWLKASYGQRKLEEVSLMTGDLLLLKTWEPLETQGSDADWNQVAMVVRDPSDKVRLAYGLKASESLFILDDTVHPKQEGEITLTPLRDWMKLYTDLFGKDVMCVYRKLDLPDRKPQDQETFPELETWLLTLKGKMYNRSKERTLTQIFRSINNNTDHHFTSQLISATYREMGIFHHEEYATEESSDLTSALTHSWGIANLGMTRGAALSGALRLVIS